MARRKQTESASQPLTKWFSSQRTAPSSPPAATTPRNGPRTGATAEAESARKRQSGRPRPLGPSVSFASTLTPLSSPLSSPIRRSTRRRPSTTPGPPPAPPHTRVYQLQPIPQMPPEIRCPSPEDSPYVPHRFSPPPFMKSFPDADSSDTEEIPSSQKDDGEPMVEDDLATIEAMPIYHSSPPTSPSSEGLITPAPATPPLPPPLSPESKARHIVEEIRAKARLAVSPTSPPLKRALAPPSDGSDDLPDAGFLMGNSPVKRRKSTTPSPTRMRRSTRKSTTAPRPPVRTTAFPRLKPERTPFASIAREHMARAKRSESLPLAPDGSRQDILAIADAALMRDPDAIEEDLVGESSQFIDADKALDKLAEGGFAAEAELVRRAGAAVALAKPSWITFGSSEDIKSGVLAAFPSSVGEFVQTPFAKMAWSKVANWIQVQDHASLRTFLGSTMLPRAFGGPQEKEMLEPVIEWLVELVFLSPADIDISESAASDVEELVDLLPPDAQDRIAAHVAQCLLRIGPPGDGVRLAREFLDASGETSYTTPSVEHRRLLIRLCASIAEGLTGATNIFPLLPIMCIIGIDPDLDSETGLQIAKAAEAWVCKAQTPQEQLVVCSRLVKGLSALPIQQKRDIVRRVFRGTRPAAGHLSMWLAIAFLDGEGMNDVDASTYTERPPLIRIFKYVEALHITPSTHYPDLLAAVQLLDIALWDVRALVDAERRAGRIVKYQAGVSPDSMVGDVSSKLMELHGKIVDARATDMEKTTTKGILQALYIRLGWEVAEAARRGQRPPGAVNTIKDMWSKPRPVRPTPKIS